MVSIGKGNQPGSWAQEDAPGYRVRSGDTLSGLAQRFGVSVAQMLKANPQITDPDRIRAGQSLTLPKTEPKASSQVAEKASAPPRPKVPRRPASTPAVTHKKAIAQESLMAHQLSGKLVVKPKDERSWIDKKAWKALAGRSKSVNSSVDLGGFGTAKLKLDEAVRVLKPKAQTADQAAFSTAAKKNGRETMWLDSGGTISIDAKLGEATNLNAKGDLSFRMSRPYTYDKSDKGSWDLTKKLVKNTYDLPLGHKDAAKLERGSEFSLQGRYGGGVALGADAVGAERRQDRDLKLNVVRGEGKNVDITVTQETLDTLGKQAKAGVLGYEGSTKTLHREVATFKLDLANPKHQEAYDRIIRGDLEAASELTGQRVSKDLDTITYADGLNVQAGLNSFLSVGLNTKRTDIDARDPRVQKNPDRKAFTESQQADGKAVRWIEVEASAKPKIGQNITSPVSLTANAESGFSASQVLEYKALVPQLDGQTHTVVPPMTAKDARGLPQGSEVTIRGKGELIGFAGTRVGQQVGGGGVATFGVSVGTRFDAGAHTKVGVRVRKLAGDKVQVHLSSGQGSSSSAQFEARVGADLESFRAFDMQQGNGVTRQLDKQLEKRAKIEFKTGTKSTESLDEGTTYELDLSKPAARQAYERLMRLDGKAATQLSDIRGSGVQLTSGRVTQEDKVQDRTELNAFGTRLFLEDALRSDKTVIETNKDGVRTTETSRFDAETEGLLGRDQKMTWEAVRVRTEGAPEGKAFYRLQYEDKDPFTSKQEMKDATRFATEMGMAPDTATKIKKADRGFFEGLLGDINRHGKTKASLEVFFTPEGIANMRGHSPEASMETYGAVVKDRTGKQPAWADPQKAKDAREMLDKYSRMKNDPASILVDEEVLKELGDKYFYLTGTDLVEDHVDYRHAQAFSKMVGRMDNEDPTQWSRAFADMGKDVRFELYDTVAAMNRLAGKDEVLVHNFSVQGDAVDLQMKDEGLVKRPR